MSKLIRNIATQRPVWTSQPQGAVDIDWSNPLTKGLLRAYGFCRAGARSIRQIPNDFATWIVRGAPAVRVGANGMSQYIPASGSVRNTDSSYLSNITQNLTVAWEGEWISANGAELFGSLDPTEGFESNFAFHGGGSGIAFCVTNASGIKVFSPYYYGMASGKTIRLVGTYDGEFVRFYVNGVFIGQTAHTGNVQANTAFHTSWGFWGGYDGLENTVRQTLILNCTWNPNQVTAWSTNPYQIFKPLNRSQPFDLVRGPTEPRPSYMMGTTAPEVSTAMPAAFLKTPCTSQPQGAIEIDWIQQKPLVFLMPSRNSFDSLRFGVPFSPAACSAVLTKYGWAIANPTNLSADPQFMISGGIWGPGCAVMTSVVCTPGNFRTTCALLTSTDNYFQLGFISASNRTLHVRVSNGTYTSTGYVLPSDGSMVTLVLYMDNGDIRLFANGALVSQLGLSCDWWYGGIAVGHIFGQWSEISPIRTLAVGNWGRITPSYAQSLSANPWQIFAPQAKQIWVTT